MLGVVPRFWNSSGQKGAPVAYEFPCGGRLCCSCCTLRLSWDRSVGLASFPDPSNCRRGLLVFRPKPASKGAPGTRQDANSPSKDREFGYGPLSPYEVFATDVGAAIREGEDDELKPPPQVIQAIIMDAAMDLYAAERFNLSRIAEPPLLLDTIDGAPYHQDLEKRHRKVADSSAFKTFRDTGDAAFRELAAAVPAAIRQPRRIVMEQLEGSAATAPFSVPLGQMLPELRQTVETLTFPFFADAAHDKELFSQLRRVIDENANKASGRTAGDDKPVVMPSESATHPSCF